MKVFVGVNRVAEDMLSDVEYHGKLQLKSARPIPLAAVGISLISDSLVDGEYTMMPNEVINVCTKMGTDLVFLIPQLEPDTVIPVSASLINATVELYAACVAEGYTNIPDDAFGFEWVDHLVSATLVEVEATGSVESV